jgi:PadR family transcriptional regulator PadR
MRRRHWPPTSRSCVAAPWSSPASSPVRRPQYGYSLLTTLTEAGIPTEANTLYPLLRRLEKQGLLSAVWNTEQARPRKYYTVTASGAEVAAALHSQWLELDSSITKLWKDGTP